MNIRNIAAGIALAIPVYLFVGLLKGDLANAEPLIWAVFAGTWFAESQRGSRNAAATTFVVVLWTALISGILAKRGVAYALGVALLPLSISAVIGAFRAIRNSRKRASPVRVEPTTVTTPVRAPARVGLGSVLQPARKVAAAFRAEPEMLIRKLVHLSIWLTFACFVGVLLRVLSDALPYPYYFFEPGISADKFLKLGAAWALLAVVATFAARTFHGRERN